MRNKIRYGFRVRSYLYSLLEIKLFLVEVDDMDRIIFCLIRELTTLTRKIKHSYGNKMY